MQLQKWVQHNMIRVNRHMCGEKNIIALFNMYEKDISKDQWLEIEVRFVPSKVQNIHNTSSVRLKGHFRYSQSLEIKTIILIYTL